MARLSVSFQSAPITAVSSAPICELQTSATDQPCIIGIELFGFPQGGASATVVIGAGNPASSGIGTGVTPLVDDAGISGASPNFNVITNWSLPPTLPTTFFRRASYQLSSTYPRVWWEFPMGLRIAQSGSFVLWQISASSTNNTSFLYTVNLKMDG